MRLSDTNTEVVRYGMTASLLYGAFIVYTCPCLDPFLNCHYRDFMLAAGAPVLLCVLLNTI